MPAMVRSLINSLSSSATAAMIENVNLPVAVVVSMASRSEMKSMFFDLKSSRAVTKCRVERANLSNFQTATMSSWPRCAACMSLSR